MCRTIGLCNLPTGCRAKVMDLTLRGDIRRRLQDIGVVEGTVIEKVGVSPLGDPEAYLIKGAVIALRRDDSLGVLVEML